MNTCIKIKKIQLMSNSGIKYDVSEKNIKISNLISEMIEDSEESNIIPLNISDDILKKIIEFCEYYSIYPLITDDNFSLTHGELISSTNIEKYVPDWYSNFIDVDVDLLFMLLKSSDFLHIDPLIELCCLKIGTLIKDKTTDELRKIFNIYDDTSVEEKEEFVQAHEWINI